MKCIGMIRREDNPADARSKVGGNTAIFNILVGMDTTKVVKWVLGKATQRKSSVECEGIESKLPKHREMIEANNVS